MMNCLLITMILTYFIAIALTVRINLTNISDSMLNTLRAKKCSNISEIGERRREGPTSGDSSHGSLENDIRINNVAFLTARPKGWRSLITTLTRNKLNRKGVSQHATLLSGSFKNLFSSKQMADKKFMNFCEYCDLFPEYDYVLLGDSGQGDARLGLMALKHDTGKFATRIRAVFLHDVTEGKTKQEMVSQKNTIKITAYFFIAIMLKRLIRPWNLA